MTSFEMCWGIYTGKGLAQKWPEPIGMLSSYPEESKQHSEHGEGLKSRIVNHFLLK
jgi:hypothetical protein